MNALGKGQVFIENSHFEDIQANEAGVFSFNNELKVNITHSMFLRNRADQSGGAIATQNDVEITIINCTFQ